MTAFRCSFGGLGTTARALALSVAVALAGCSTLQDVAGVMHPGYQSDGTYVLSDQEQGLGCRQLQERSLGVMEQLKALPAKALDEMQKMPDNMAAAFGRLFGSPGSGVTAYSEYNEARAESAALNAEMAKKGCGSASLNIPGAEANGQTMPSAQVASSGEVASSSH